MPGQDVIVIGGGIIGCSVARELARRGASAWLFEARTVGAGATQASAGILAPYIEGHDRGQLFDLGLRSLRMADAFVRDVCDESAERRIPALRHAGSGDRRSHRHAPARNGQRQAALARSRGCARPGGRARSAIEGALLATEHGYVAVPLLMDALAWAALRHGVQIEAAHRVTSIRVDSSHVSIGTDDRTSWTAGTVVIAAGSWAGHLDVDDGAAAAVRPVRGQLLRLQWRGAPLHHIVWGPDCYVVPLAGQDGAGGGNRRGRGLR